MLHKITIPDLLRRGPDNSNRNVDQNPDLTPGQNHNPLPGRNQSKPFSVTKITNNPSHWDHHLRPSITSLNHNNSSSSHNNRLGNNNRLFPNNNSSKTLHLLNNSNSNNNHNLDDPQDWDLKV